MALVVDEELLRMKCVVVTTGQVEGDELEIYHQNFRTISLLLDGLTLSLLVVRGLSHLLDRKLQHRK